MLKKLLIIVILVILILFIYIRYSESDYSKIERTKIVVRCYGSTESPRGKAFINNIYKFRELHPEIKVIWEMYDKDVYSTVISKAFYNGEKMDLYYSWEGELELLLSNERHTTIDHRALIDPDKFESDSLVELGKEKEILFVPVKSPSYNVFYSNDDLLQNFGFEAAKTYEDLIKQKSMAEANGIRVLAYPFREKWVKSSFLVSLFLGRFGGAGYLEDLRTGKGKFSDDPFIKTFKIIMKIFSDRIINESDSHFDYDDALEQFNKGKALYYFDSIRRSVDIEPTMNYSINTFPKVPGEILSNSTTLEPWEGWSITHQASKDPKQFKAAKTFLNFITGEEASLERARTAGIIPAIIMEKKPAFPKGMDPEDINFEADPVITGSIISKMSPELSRTLNYGIDSMSYGIYTPKELGEKLDFDKELYNY